MLFCVENSLILKPAMALEIYELLKKTKNKKQKNTKIT